MNQPLDVGRDARPARRLWWAYDARCTGDWQRDGDSIEGGCECLLKHHHRVVMIALDGVSVMMIRTYGCCGTVEVGMAMRDCVMIRLR